MTIELHKVTVRESRLRRAAGHPTALPARVRVQGEGAQRRHFHRHARLSAERHVLGEESGRHVRGDGRPAAHDLALPVCGGRFRVGRAGLGRQVFPPPAAGRAAEVPRLRADGVFLRGDAVREDRLVQGDQHRGAEADGTGDAQCRLFGPVGERREAVLQQARLRGAEDRLAVPERERGSPGVPGDRD